MFEKEAEEYAVENYETCLYDDLPYANDFKAREKAFKDGAEFGYNKTNEWHDLRKNPEDLPKGDCKVLTYSEVQMYQIKQFFAGDDVPCFDDLACKEVIAWCKIPEFVEE